MADIKAKYPGFITIDDAKKLKWQQVYDMQTTYMNKTYTELLTSLGTTKLFVSRNLNDPAGVEMIDDEGNVHYDLISNVGSVPLGNASPYIWSQLEKCKDIPAFNCLGLRAMAAALANNLALVSPGDLKRCWFGVGGAENNEGAIKLVKLYFKGARHKFVALKGGYHGKTQGSLALTGKDYWKLYQSPLMPGVTHIEKENIAALEEALMLGDVAGFILEPIQGEGGIHPISIEYLQAAREITKKYGTLMICDEIQCGMGRSGKLWCFEHAGIVPDVVVFAKGISGGAIPFGGYITTDEIFDGAYGNPMTAFHHTITYANNTLGCAAGIATLQYILENDLTTRAAVKGAEMIEKMEALRVKYPGMLKPIRGRGLMIGMEFDCGDPVKSVELADGASAKLGNKYNIQTVHTINNAAVIRILPPLTITDAQLDYFLTSFDKVLGELANEFGLACQAAAAKA